MAGRFQRGDSWRRSQSESLQQNIWASQSGDRHTRRPEQTCVCPSNSWRFRWTPVTRLKGRMVLDFVDCRRLIPW